MANRLRKYELKGKSRCVLGHENGIRGTCKCCGIHHLSPANLAILGTWDSYIDRNLVFHQIFKIGLGLITCGSLYLAHPAGFRKKTAS